MRRWGLLTAVFAVAVGIMVAFGADPGAAQLHPRAHVYLLRGLLSIFSLGMDTLAEELKRRGVDATVDNYSEWQTLADQTAADYKAGKEAPIILIGHSLGADAVMEMAAYLGRKGVPVALVVPFDCTKSFAASDNGRARAKSDAWRDRYLYARRTWFPRHARQCRCQFRSKYRPHQYR